MRKYKTVTGFLDAQFGIENTKDTGMTEDEHRVWQLAILDLSTHDCIVGYKVNVNKGQDTVKWFLPDEYNDAINLASSIDGATVEQVNKSDIII